MPPTHSNVIYLKDYPHFIEKYDPAWLVEASYKVAEEYPWLPQALCTCTHIKAQGEFYIHFVSSKNPNQPSSVWQYQEGIILDTPEGDVILDIVKNNIVGGVELLSKLLWAQ